MMIVVVARDVGIQRFLASALETAETDVTMLSSLAELPEILKNIPLNGILIDLITSTRSTAQEKRDTNDLIQYFPNARFKFIDNEVRLLGHGLTLEQFVSDCRLIKPRTIRKSERKIRHIAMLLSANGEFFAAEKTVTIDISEEGCFVFSTCEWSVGDRIWLRLLDNDCVLTGRVCSWQPWGNNKKMPGIGVKLDISEMVLK